MPASDEPIRPARPSIPFTFWLLIVVIGSCQAVLRRSLRLPEASSIALAIVAFSAATVFLLAIRSRPEEAALIAAAACAAAISLVISSLGVERGLEAVEMMEGSPVSSWSFAVLGDSRLSHGRFRARARASLDGAHPVDVWLYTYERTYPGMILSGIGRAMAQGEDVWDGVSRSQGVFASVTLLRIEHVTRRPGLPGMLDTLRRRLSDSLNPSLSASRAFMAACSLGDRSGFEALDIDGDLRRCGVSHLVAVSGTHLALVAMAISASLDAAETRFRTRAAAIVILTGLFVVLCGAPASAIRAWIMATIHATAVFAKRRGYSLSALCAAGIAMALADPFVTGQLAYQLSIAAVMGIGVINPYVRYVLEVLLHHRSLPRRVSYGFARKLGNLERSVIDLLALSITAQIATLPITTASFSEISLVAPLANLLASPLIALLTVLGLAACASAPVHPAQTIVLACAEPVGSLLEHLLHTVSSLRFSAIAVPSYGHPASLAVLFACLAIVWFSPQVTRRMIIAPPAIAGIAFCSWFAYHRFLSPARMVVLDIGQGDAILIQEGPHAVLVDAGPSGPLDEALHRNGVFHLDAIILSHLHNDHYGGGADLPGEVACERILVAEGSAEHAPQELAEAARRLGALPFDEISLYDTVRFGSFRLTVVAPAGPVDGLENEDSMFLVLEYDDGVRSMSALLTGDGEHAELASAMACCNLGCTDILKVGHHGSEGSILSPQAEVLSPRYAVASAGRENEFGHPHRSCVGVLERVGAVFLCTKDRGDIVMVPTRGGAVCARPRTWMHPYAARRSGARLSSPSAFVVQSIGAASRRGRRCRGGEAGTLERVSHRGYQRAQAQGRPEEAQGKARPQPRGVQPRRAHGLRRDRSLRAHSIALHGSYRPPPSGNRACCR